VSQHAPTVSAFCGNTLTIKRLRSDSTNGGRADSSPESGSSLNLNRSIHWSKRTPDPSDCSSSAVDPASQGSPGDAGPSADDLSGRLPAATGSPARAPPLEAPSAVLFLLLLLLLLVLLLVGLSLLLPAAVLVAADIEIQDDSLWRGLRNCCE
jgi:hypothetical protein